MPRPKLSPHSRLPLLLLFVGLLVAPFGFSAQADEPAETEAQAEAAKSAREAKFFETKVHPILARRCYSCHSAENQEGGLRVDGRAFLLAGVDGRPVVRPGRPEESPLVAAVRRQGDIQMPPEDPLPAEEVETLVRWVQLGLPWPASPDQPAPVPTREEQFDEQRSTHWAYQPIARPDVPALDEDSWSRNALDRYVLRELRAEGITPSPEAERRVLIRRATFDLLGLPPTPREVEAFVDDDRPGAYARLIDRLLASPHYGERWGRHWLDVARYADTKGYAFGRERRYPYSYTYRDYVIGALNRDLPYDRFLLEQLAADLLPLDDTAPELAALGFLTVGRKFNNRHDDIDDQIDVVCRGLMGLTVACARCHDHKYDAIPTQDYYSLYGVFASSQEPSELPLIGDPHEVRGYEAFQRELDQRKAKVDAYRRERHAALLEQGRRHVADYLARAVSGQEEAAVRQLPAVELDQAKLKPRLLDAWRKFLARESHARHPVWSALHEVSRWTPEQYRERADAWRKQLAERPAGTAEGQLNPRLREDLLSAAPASRAELAAVYGKALREAYEAWKAAGASDAALESLTPEMRQLAEALVKQENPTSVTLEQVDGFLDRAERNKFRELQKQVDSFQVNSPNAPPRAMVVQENPQPHDPRVFIRGNHARPGDAVPRQFLYVLAGPERQPFEQGSGRLELARRITSPDNPLTRRVIVNRVWMHHFGQPLITTPSDFGIRTAAPRHRELLDYLAWLLADRDWSLKALHREILLSGTYRQSSVARADAEAKDPENQLLWRMNRRRLEFEPLRDALFAVAGQLDTTLGGRPVDLFQPPYAPRRAVYGFIDRQDLPNLLRVFDFASPDQSSARRPRTTVPQQALFLMNSPLVIQQARALVARPDIQQASEPAERIDRLYRVLFGRPPSDREREIGRRFVEAERSTPESEAKELGAWPRYAQLLMLSNEFLFID